MLAATAVLGVTTAFAANPFSDVTPDSWAYQAVSQLAQAGIVNGYPDGTFKGQNNITRYEMAQMVAKAMANQDRANAEQQAMINRLASEFSDELNNLGVRVTNLENKVGNVKFTGDARLRYQDAGTDGDAVNSKTKKTSQWDYRVRLQANAQVDDSTTATARLVLQDDFGNSESRLTDDDQKGYSNVTFDRAYVTHKFGGNVVASAGRQNLFLGQGLLYDDMFDGATAQVKLGKHAVVTGGYGYVQKGNLFEDNTGDFAATVAQLDIMPTTTTKVTGFYLKANETDSGRVHAAGFKDAYGFAGMAGINKFTAQGEWAKSNVTDSGAWTAGLMYGNYKQAKQGTWDVGVRYFNEDVNAPVLSSTFTQNYATDYKAWAAQIDYALKDNLGLNAYYYFNGETQDGTDVDDFYRVELKYKF